MVNPNQAQVLQLFGAYRGTAKAQGLRWANPLLAKKMVSQRVRNFESSHLKVNDNEGNPIEIAAVVVWKVVDTAEAVFEVDDFENYVHVQTEAAAAEPGDELPLRRARRTLFRFAATRRPSPTTSNARCRIASPRQASR